MVEYLGRTGTFDSIEIHVQSVYKQALRIINLTIVLPEIEILRNDMNLKKSVVSY